MPAAGREKTNQEMAKIGHSRWEWMWQGLDWGAWGNKDGSAWVRWGSGSSPLLGWCHHDDIEGHGR